MSRFHYQVQHLPGVSKLWTDTEKSGGEGGAMVQDSSCYVSDHFFFLVALAV